MTEKMTTRGKVREPIKTIRKSRTVRSCGAGAELSVFLPRLASLGGDGAQSEALIVEIYSLGFCYERRALERLEYDGYLEKILWSRLVTCCKASVSCELALSIVALVNEKGRLGRLAEAWRSLLKLESNGKKIVSPFGRLLERCCDLLVGKEASHENVEREALLHFFVWIYGHLEHTSLRKAALKLCSLPLWERLGEARRGRELRAFPQLRRHWQHHLAKHGKHKASTLEATFFPSLLDGFGSALTDGALNGDCLSRFLELLIDLLSQLPTRRFLRAVVEETRFLERLTLSPFSTSSNIAPLVNAFRVVLNFEINDQTGQVPKRGDAKANQHRKLYALQCACFQHYPDIPFARELAFTSTARIADRKQLEELLRAAGPNKLEELCCEHFNLLPPSAIHDRQDFLLEMLLNEYCERPDTLTAVNEDSLYPNEDTLWGEIPPSSAKLAAWSPLPLPKLNLQFLTFHDYLLRSFTLYRLESAYEVRADLVDCVRRLKPCVEPKFGTTRFEGWSRMAVQAECAVTRVSKPRLGKSYPAEVLCEVTVDLTSFGARGTALREEWEGLREHDVLFLICVDAAVATGSGDCPATRGGFRDDTDDEAFASRFGVRAVRGGELVSVNDDMGVLVGSFAEQVNPGRERQARGNKSSGSRRTLMLRLDPVQYRNDASAGHVPLYSAANCVMRRDGRANNFRPVLETIRDLINAEAVDATVPRWLRDAFLGYGEAAAAHYTAREIQLDSFDAVDTFLDFEHCVSSFPGFEVIPGEEVLNQRPFFKLAIDRDRKIVKATPYAPPYIDILKCSPLAEEHIKLFGAARTNLVRFTPTQVEAIRDGMNPGLTLVVGPPGTGKTDVAVQIVANLHRNFPEERTLLIAHSNVALNDLFEKIMERDVPARKLVRLGSGAQCLEDGSFSRLGRVDATLSRRLVLLDEVQRLAQTLRSHCAGNIVRDVDAAGYTCETAEYFERTHVDNRVALFRKRIKAASSVQDIEETFPFALFFLPNEARKLFGSCRTIAEAIAAADGCISHLRAMFSEIREYRAFELLRSNKQRTDYLLTKQARVVAMTCTHAALARRDLVRVGFKYDNVLIEEAAQILEIEAFVPMLLHPFEDGSRLKRVILIGDHCQLPPVIKNKTLASYSRLDQSLFARFLRLGSPAVHLDSQGRCRPSIAQLFSWKYSNLGNLDVVRAGPYTSTNPGFVFDYQFVDVGDFQGRGEHCPTPHYFQNLGEAEYVVATYMYMRLLGYPADRITVLAAYNGQKSLLSDIFKTRCGDDPLYGLPKIVETVDKYQGSQNDYVLLSLVRTKHVGHLRDVRRLVVATSRARLGLYIFGRKVLFRSCQDLDPITNTLFQRTTKLTLAYGQTYCHVDDKHHKHADKLAKQVHIDGLIEMGHFVCHIANRANYL